MTLKVMPRITLAHVQPNSFEKMRVNLAYQLFSEEVLKGLFFYKDHLQQAFSSVQPTEKFVQVMEKLIYVMSSRIPSKSLRTQSGSARFLEEFILFLNEWEEYAAQNGGGFLSPVTAVGLRVTVRSTLSLLDYLTSSLGYKYLLTANLSQDRIENLFGIVRQSFGCNDHPSPEQFLVIINNLTFYSLAKPPKSGNSPPELISALLHPSTTQTEKAARISQLIDDLLNQGNLSQAEVIFAEHEDLLEHQSYTEKRSDSRLIFYIAGYVVRRSLKRMPCVECASSLTILPLQAVDSNASFTKQFDHGGLVYPSKSLSQLVGNLEDAFTVFFSRNKLETESIISFLTFLRGHSIHEVGCEAHGRELTTNVIKFYVLTRFHFYTKSLNKDQSSAREKQKLLKMRRCR